MVKTAPPLTASVKRMSDKRRLTISLDTPDYAELTTIADQEDRSLSWVVSQAVKVYLERAKQSEGRALPRESQVRLALE